MNYPRATTTACDSTTLTLKLIITIKIGYRLFRILIANINWVTPQDTAGGVLLNVWTTISSNEVFVSCYLYTIIDIPTLYVLCYSTESYVILIRAESHKVAKYSLSKSALIINFKFIHLFNHVFSFINNRGAETGSKTKVGILKSYQRFLWLKNLWVDHCNGCIKFEFNDKSLQTNKNYELRRLVSLIYF